jgi:Tfp pilus assembly protein PilN
MKNDMQILIEKDRLTFWHPKAGETVSVEAGRESPIGGQLKKFRRQAGIASNNVALFMAEDLLFYKFLQLPLKTPDLKEAIGYQLAMLTPFAEDDFLYGFETSRQKDGYDVHLYATRRQPLTGYLQDLVRTGFRVTGFFPEHQRYLTRDNRRQRWALVLPGRFTKVLTFADGRLEKRLLSNIIPDFARLVEVCGTGTIYHPQPPSSQFHQAGSLLTGEPLLKEYNMLPASYRRPDYLKMAIAALAVINFAALLGWSGINVHHLLKLENTVGARITALAPDLDEFNQLRNREQQLLEETRRLEEVGRNPDLIAFLQQLTRSLPSNSYLAQMRKDPTGNAISMQGYTGDIAELTASLRSLGDAKLKSTSRRQNQTYFDVEVNLP